MISDYLSWTHYLDEGNMFNQQNNRRILCPQADNGGVKHPFTSYWQIIKHKGKLSVQTQSLTSHNMHNH
jgi:hypothetical protein